MNDNFIYKLDWKLDSTKRWEQTNLIDDVPSEMKKNVSDSLDSFVKYVNFINYDVKNIDEMIIMIMIDEILDNGRFMSGRELFSAKLG